MIYRKIELISVDLQKEFTRQNGLLFIKGESINFIKDTFLPFIKNQEMVIHEIISDYRIPRLDRKNSYCDPNTIGFQSEIPNNLKSKKPWVKCMHNPIWMRDNIGLKNLIPGEPYQNPTKFNEWLISTVGLPSKSKLIVLFGLTMEICMLSVAQELYFRGYDVAIIYEATDPMNERLDYKDFIAFHSSLTLYAKVIKFEKFKEILIMRENNE